MTDELFQSVLEARDVDEYRQTVVHIARQLGFDTVTAMMVIDHRDVDTEFLVVENTPEAYRDCANDLARGQTDPVMQHCKYRSSPIIWDQTTYLKAGRIDRWETQAAFGYRTGICLAFHMPEGLHFVLGVDRDQALPRDRAEIGRMLSTLQLFAVYAQDSAIRVLLPPRDEPAPPRLSAQEIDCLRWTMEGKMLWEVGAILHIAESTALHQLNNAMRKLSCVNPAHAALKALRLGLIR
ncbi:MAG TPA: LuxR family transcriptional regulator [Hyphomicrobium sp.]|nr:LuxR family transcriptional regulator [Hyphomicrobium sp.]